MYNEYIIGKEQPALSKKGLALVSLQKLTKIPGKLRRIYYRVLNRLHTQNRYSHTGEDNEGITVIILSYRRMNSLRVLLKSLHMQHLGDIKLEIILINNSSQRSLRKSSLTRLGRVLNQFEDIKIINSSHNWMVSIRYAMGQLAKYETILYMDDDMYFLDADYLKDMYAAFKSVRPIDILGCWNTLWLAYDNVNLKIASVTLNDAKITQLTETDINGAGCCMFSRELLSNPAIMGITARQDDMAFSLQAALEYGSRNYYFPSHQRVAFHHERQLHAIHDLPDKTIEKLNLYRQLWLAGYQPVIERLAEEGKPLPAEIQHATTVEQVWNPDSTNQMRTPAQK